MIIDMGDILECVGCGITSEDLKSEGWTDNNIDENSVWMDCGHWYCHDDCLKDSR